MVRRAHPFDVLFASSVVGIAIVAFMIWLDPLGIVSFVRGLAYRNAFLWRIYEVLRAFSATLLALIVLLALMRLFSPGVLSRDLARKQVSSRRSEQDCSFCSRTNVEAGPLVEGPRDVFICAACCARLPSQFAAAPSAGRCSFCRKDSSKVGQLVTSDKGVLICGKCVVLATRILDREQRRRAKV